jgi:hypothetical protein
MHTLAAFIRSVMALGKEVTVSFLCSAQRQPFSSCGADTLGDLLIKKKMILEPGTGGTHL